MIHKFRIKFFFRSKKKKLLLLITDSRITRTNCNFFFYVIYEEVRKVINHRVNKASS